MPDRFSEIVQYKIYNIYGGDYAINYIMMVFKKSRHYNYATVLIEKVPTETTYCRHSI